MKPLTNEMLIEEAKSIWDMVDDGGSVEDIAEFLQAKQDDMVEKFKEAIGDDEDEYEVGFYKGKMTGRVRKTGEEIPLRMELKQADRNELRASLRSKLSNLSEK